MDLSLDQQIDRAAQNVNDAICDGCEDLHTDERLQDAAMRWALLADRAERSRIDPARLLAQRGRWYDRACRSAWGWFAARPVFCAALPFLIIIVLFIVGIRYRLNEVHHDQAVHDGAAEYYWTSDGVRRWRMLPGVEDPK